MRADDKLRGLAGICGLLSGPVLIAAQVAGTFAQPDEFSFVDHAGSDLGADTANSAWISNQLGSNLPGFLLLVFAIGLWSSLGHHASARIGSALVGAVGVGAFMTGFLTLDCREIDPGCENTSWQATGHVIVAVPTLLALLVSPFVLARALRFAAPWRDLRKTTLALGVGTVAALFVGSAIGEGFGQYLAFILWFGWIAILAIRMIRLARDDASAADRTR